MASGRAPALARRGSPRPALAGRADQREQSVAAQEKRVLRFGSVFLRAWTGREEQGDSAAAAAERGVKGGLWAGKPGATTSAAHWLPHAVAKAVCLLSLRVPAPRVEPARLAAPAHEGQQAACAVLRGAQAAAFLGLRSSEGRPLGASLASSLGSSWVAGCRGGEGWQRGRQEAGSVGVGGAGSKACRRSWGRRHVGGRAGGLKEIRASHRCRPACRLLGDMAGRLPSCQHRCGRSARPAPEIRPRLAAPHLLRLGLGADDLGHLVGHGVPLERIADVHGVRACERHEAPRTRRSASGRLAPGRAAPARTCSAPVGAGCM